VAGGIFDLQVNDSTLVADNFAFPSFWDNTSFNGWVLTDTTSSPITSVTIDGATNMAGFGPSNVSFTGNTVTVNWSGLRFDGSTVVQLELNGGAVPEPASLALFGLGLTGIAAALWRRSRKSS
jgi:hypothetical protein